MDKPESDLGVSRAGVILALALVGYGCSLVGLGPKYRENKPPQCTSNLKRLAVSVLLYAGDWDDRAPFAYNWHSETQPYRENKDCRCPQVEKEHKTATGYAYDSRLHGLDLHRVADPEKQTLVFDSTSLAKDSSDPFTSPPMPGRHGGYNNVGYVDGHVNTVAFPASGP